MKGGDFMLKEFKEFAMRGSVVDLAVGFIVGVAFAKITTSLVNDIIMPPIGLFLGKVDFSNLFINLSDQEFISLAEAQTAGVATINYGIFINTIIEFIIIALVIFLVVQQINKSKKKEEEKMPEPSNEEVLLGEIRDTLRSKVK